MPGRLSLSGLRGGRLTRIAPSACAGYHTGFLALIVHPAAFPLRGQVVAECLLPWPVGFRRHLSLHRPWDSGHKKVIRGKENLFSCPDSLERSHREHPMQVQQKFTYILEVTRPELIGLALAGKLRGSDAQAALDLNRKLLQAQAHELSEELGRVDGALERATSQASEPA